MTEYGPRVAAREVTLANRPWNDVREELQNILTNLVLQSDVTNIVLQELRISEGGGTTTVEFQGGDGDDALMLMGG